MQLIQYFEQHKENTRVSSFQNILLYVSVITLTFLMFKSTNNCFIISRYEVASLFSVTYIMSIFRTGRIRIRNDISFVASKELER
jgi:hypothetical protein